MTEFVGAATVTVNPLAALVVIVTSWAPIAAVPTVKVPKGIVLAVVVMFVVALLTVPPEVTAAMLKVKFESTEAVIAIEVEVKVAAATVTVSIVVDPASE